MRIAEMDAADLEEYTYDKQHELIGEKATLDGLTATAAVIGLSWKALGHPAAATGWAEAAVMLEKAADAIEQAIREVSDE